MSGSGSAASNCSTNPSDVWQSANPGANALFGQWRLASRLEFGSLPSAVPCARLHARHIFREWNLAHVADDAELIVSELMTNALKAARQQPDIRPITLHLLANRDYLMIQVWDALAVAPAPRPHTVDAETGRGLEIVTLLSDRWGFHRPIGGGKVVWAALGTATAPGARTDQEHERAPHPARRVGLTP